MKNSRGFSESAIDKLIVHLPELLDFTRDERVLAKRFIGRVIEIIRRLLAAYRSLDMPTLDVYCAFASLKAVEVHANTRGQGGAPITSAESCFGASTPKTHFLDAASVAGMARERPPTTRELALAENPISTDAAGGYIGVAKLDEYQRFITDPLWQARRVAVRGKCAGLRGRNWCEPEHPGDTRT